MSMNNTVSFRDGNNIDNCGDNIRSNPDKSRARNVTNGSANTLILIMTIKVMMIISCRIEKT